jgi:hypothetical protein
VELTRVRTRRLAWPLDGITTTGIYCNAVVACVFSVSGASRRSDVISLGNLIVLAALPSLCASSDGLCQHLRLLRISAFYH